MPCPTTRRPIETAGRSPDALVFRSPTAEDGVEIADLIAACPPLERNSLYCNLLQCTDFADTCILAESGRRAVGWLSGYRPPASRHTLFVWQVAVHPDARGLGLAKTMILTLLERPGCRDVTGIEATVTPGNGPSWALFGSVAASLGAPFEQRPWLDAETMFRGRHESEHRISIGPIRRAPAAGTGEPARIPLAQAPVGPIS